jgi:Uma2 family endonuclease
MSMSAAPEAFRMSVEAYLALDNASPQTRYEYLDGRVLMMSGGSLQHAFISANVIGFFNQALRGSSCRTYTSDARVKLTESHYVYPDATVSCTSRPDVKAQTITEPTVIVEVLSPGTEAYDRGRKLESYRACPSLQSVLLISQDRPAIDVYRRRSADIWTVQTYYLDDAITLEAIPVTLPVAEVYYDITFAAEAEETPESQP